MSTELDPRNLDLNPDIHCALHALLTAGLPASIICADGGGYHIHVPGPGDTYLLIGCSESLPARDEPLTGYHAQLQSADGDFVSVVYDSFADPMDDTVGDPDPHKLAAAILHAFQNHSTAAPAQPADPDTSAVPDVHAGMRAVLDALTFTDLEGGDILEDIIWRLRRLGFDLTPRDADNPDKVATEQRATTYTGRADAIGALFGSTGVYVRDAPVTAVEVFTPAPAVRLTLTDIASGTERLTVVLDATTGPWAVHPAYAGE
ncbi:hypothetical protein [Kitasatospora sp. NPDC088548]|uniref:hypothetical protein n=1 Tax=Kitasatospora sp. NPDC088548 TaxID=3364075 RepID=UPI00382BF4F3